MSLRTQYGLIVLLAVAIAFQALHQWKSVDENGKRAIVVRDFGAFYCAGATRNAGRNPYLAADFTGCGRRDSNRTPVRDRFDSPAPIPGYDVALFAILARLPYSVAAYLWLALSLAAAFFGAVALARCANLPPLLVAVCFSIDTLLALGWGQVTPIALGALCFAAFAVDRKSWWLASAAAIVTAIEPHVGFPVIVAALVFVPSMRLPISIGIAILAVTSLAAVGVHGNIEYFTKVTPLHVMAEVPMSNQYSLTWLLHGFGASTKWAIRLGSISYALMVLIGLALCRPATRIARTPAAIVLVPVATCVFGGPFIHGNQIALALPAILLVAGRSDGRETRLWLAAICLSVIWWVPQWQISAYSPSRLEGAFLVAAIVYYASYRTAPKQALRNGLGGAVLYFGATFFILHLSSPGWYTSDSPIAYTRQIGSDIAYASGRYGVTIRENASLLMRYSWQTIAYKIPFWLAPLLLIGVIATKRRAIAPAR